MNYVKYEVHAIGGPGHCGHFEASFPVAMLFLGAQSKPYLDRGWSCQFTPESLINKLYSKLGETYWTVCTT